MEVWFMECVAFGCVAVGVCSIVYLVVRGFVAMCKLKRDEEFAFIEKENMALREQVDGLRSNLKEKEIKLCEAHDLIDDLYTQINRLHYEIDAAKRGNK